MTKNTYITGGIALVLAVTSVVIGRYAGYGADLLRIDALLGYVVVATLIALITLEYRVASSRAVTTRLAAPKGGEHTDREAKVVPLVRHDDRAAA